MLTDKERYREAYAKLHSNFVYMPDFIYEAWKSQPVQMNTLSWRTSAEELKKSADAAEKLWQDLYEHMTVSGCKVYRRIGGELVKSATDVLKEERSNKMDSNTYYLYIQQKDGTWYLLFDGSCIRCAAKMNALRRVNADLKLKMVNFRLLKEPTTHESW